jgi:recombination protein RecR
MPESLRKLVELISYLPGIGEKTATKLAFFLLKANPSFIRDLSDRISRVQSDIRECPVCFSLTDRSDRPCAICEDSLRDGRSLCVVEDYLDLVSIERLGIYKGRYHVLGGSVSPMHGRMPSDLHMKELFERVEKGGFEELILATNPNIEGEATSLYIKENVKTPDIRITRLSRGLPNAGFIEYADDLTLINAFRGRG